MKLLSHRQSKALHLGMAAVFIAAVSIFAAVPAYGAGLQGGSSFIYVEENSGCSDEAEGFETDTVHSGGAADSSDNEYREEDRDAQESGNDLPADSRTEEALSDVYDENPPQADKDAPSTGDKIVILSGVILITPALIFMLLNSKRKKRGRG